MLPRSLFDDLPWGLPMPCGEALISKEDVVEFGRTYDPLPFHVDQAAAARSFFGGLVASGAHIASAASALVRRTLLNSICIVGGSLGVEKLELLRPVPAGTKLRVVHTIVCPRELEPWMRSIPEGWGLAECRTEAFDPTGALLMRCTDLQSLGRPSAVGVFDTDQLELVKLQDFPRQPRPAPSGPLGTCLEDCQEGVWFGGGPRIVLSKEQADFARQFGSTGTDGGNDWHGFSYTVGLVVDAMWRHGHPVAGAAVERLTWGTPPRPGQELYCDVLVRRARPSRSRPDLGILDTTVYCSAADSHLVCQFNITSLVRKRVLM